MKKLITRFSFLQRLALLLLGLGASLQIIYGLRHLGGVSGLFIWVLFVPPPLIIDEVVKALKLRLHTCRKVQGLASCILLLIYWYFLYGR